MTTTIPPISEAEASVLFNVDLGTFVEGTNKYVDESDRIEGDELTALYGKDMWTVCKQRVPKVVDPSAMDADELQACQRAERAERTVRFAEIVNDRTLKQLEDSDVSLTDLLPPPTHIKA